MSSPLSNKPQTQTSGGTKGEQRGHVSFLLKLYFLILCWCELGTVSFSEERGGRGCGAWIKISSGPLPQSIFHPPSRAKEETPGLPTYIFSRECNERIDMDANVNPALLFLKQEQNRSDFISFLPIHLLSNFALHYNLYAFLRFTVPEPCTHTEAENFSQLDSKIIFYSREFARYIMLRILSVQQLYRLFITRSVEILIEFSSFYMRDKRRELVRSVNMYIA